MAGFREVRRRLKVRGCFQNSKSCDRIIYAIFNYFNTKWTRNTEKIKAIKNVTDQAAQAMGTPFYTFFFTLPFSLLPLQAPTKSTILNCCDYSEPVARQKR
jgi:hypothetical protein